MLRSQPSLSWISLGFPDGSFFGARKASDTEIDMIEVKWDPATATARQRTDYYTPEIGDIHFNNRELEASIYKATAQAWYRRAVAANAPVWNRVSEFPGSNRQAISVSTPLEVENQFVASSAFRPPVIKDTTGAGDAFRAGFIYGLCKGLSIEETMRAANAVAALQCREVGARDGLPTEAELQQFLGR